ncbi:hypothetical protein [Pontibacter silvestris]
MKNKITFLLLLFVTVLGFTACDDDDNEPFFDPTRLAIGGPDEVAPGTNRNYTIGNITSPETYTWSVEGPAQIVGSNTGATITVAFQSVGEAVITATNGTETGRLTVEVANVAPAVTATLDTTAMGQQKALRNGESDTVFFEFDAPFRDIESFGINTEDSTAFNQGTEPFTSGTLGELSQLDNGRYYAIYTAGPGNGTPEAKFANIIATSEYGSDTVETAYVQLYRVDNIAPVVDFTYSQPTANEGTVVTVTATFSEAVMPADPADTLLFVTLSGAGTSAERDTLMATDNPLVYTFEYEVSETATNGPVQIGIEGVVDFAGNELAGVNNASDLVIDNTNPTVTGTATDAGNSASIAISSTEAGTGMYLIMRAGADAPTDADEFMAAQGVASRSVELTAGTSKTVTQALAAGNYVVYFMAMDAAGNYSGIESNNLIMN